MGRDLGEQLPRYPLVLCASLVQNPANLGGLCRTAEVFGLESLVIANGAIALSREFRRLAVSAHHWQPLLYCPIQQLPDWFAQKRAKGYQIIALQRNAEAISLTQFTFSRYAVLVLGRELTGIPVPILTLCDQVVMIPQFGRVDSLNVQVAGAIAIYEYIKQQHLKNS